MEFRLTEEAIDAIVQDWHPIVDYHISVEIDLRKEGIYGTYPGGKKYEENYPARTMIVTRSPVPLQQTRI